MAKYSISTIPRLTQAPKPSQADSIIYLRAGKLDYGEEIKITDNCLISGYPPFTIESHTLGSLMGIDRIIKRANLTPYAELNRIIWFESSNDSNAKNPKSSAIGFCQIIKSTREMIEKAIGEIDWKNPDEQLRACVWLYENGVPENEWAETEHLWKTH